MTLGSLFDGSGTCPLAAAMCGITPVWASEIEPYPIRVTQKNFPGMRHLGDITQISGAEIEPVDIVAYDARGNGDGEIVPTLTGDHESRVTDYTALVVGNGQLNQMSMSDKAGALNCMHDQQAVLLKRLWHYIVRRLTPLECCRLQGFPDWWEDGVGGSDSARYKMWGNGMALPCVLYVMEGIADGAD